MAADSSFCRVESGLMHSVSAGMPTGRVSAEPSVWHSCSPVSGGARCSRALVASWAMASAWCRHCSRASSFSWFAALSVASKSCRSSALCAESSLRDAVSILTFSHLVA